MTSLTVVLEKIWKEHSGSGLTRHIRELDPAYFECETNRRAKCVIGPVADEKRSSAADALVRCIDSFLSELKSGIQVIETLSQPPYANEAAVWEWIDTKLTLLQDQRDLVTKSYGALMGDAVPPYLTDPIIARLKDLGPYDPTIGNTLVRARYTEVLTNTLVSFQTLRVAMERECRSTVYYSTSTLTGNRELRIGTFNVGGAARFSSSPSEASKAALVALIAGHYDVIALTEFPVESDMLVNDLRARMPGFTIATEHTRGEAIAVCYRHTTVGQLGGLNSIPSEVANLTRPIAAIVLRSGVLTFALLVVHLKSGNAKTAQAQRETEFTEVDKVAGALRDAYDGVVVVGDFNATDPLEYKLKELKATIHGSTKRDAAEDENKYWDNVLLSCSLQDREGTSSSKILHDGPTFSDHYPVVIKLKTELPVRKYSDGVTDVLRKKFKSLPLKE